MANTQILMIEDDLEDVALISAYLRQEARFATTLEHLSTLQEGLDYLKQSAAVDLVLLDLGLSDGYGLETFRTVRTAFPGMPLIVLSGNTDEDIALQALKAGAQDYLVKGRFDSSLLGRSIRYAIERQTQHLELESKTQALRQLSEQLQEMNQELEQLATTDSLTRVYNRRRFDDAFLLEWNRSLREGQPLSIVMCDVDHFKAYNDTYGHPAGDRCLQQVAAAISKAGRRPADIVARYGGEEFVLALPRTDLKGATYVAEAIRTELQAANIPHATSAVSDRVTVSIGVATQIPCKEIAPSQLLEAADRALYVAKERGRDRVQAHQADCSSETLKSREGLQWVSRLRQALERDTFALYAQPIQSLGGNHIDRRYEILLRLYDRPGPACTPGLFLPIAQQYDFLGQIDRWVVERLFARLAREGVFQRLPQSKFYINLSDTTCRHERFATFVEQQLRRHHLAAEHFCFEISEAVATAHIEAASQLAQSLQQLGCQVALDDFGSGMTSFTHLKEIPVDYVKIDGLFIRDIDTNLVSKTIVESIHRIAKLMHRETIAEFVESQTILDTLNMVGVDYAQGHYFDRARPLSQVLALVAFCRSSGEEAG